MAPIPIGNALQRPPERTMLLSRQILNFAALLKRRGSKGIVRRGVGFAPSAADLYFGGSHENLKAAYTFLVSKGLVMIKGPGSDFFWMEGQPLPTMSEIEAFLRTINERQLS